MKTFLQDLFTYNRIVNEKMETVLSANPQVRTRTFELMSHILLVHRIWNNRIMGLESAANLWTLPLDEYKGYITSEHARSLEIIDLKDLNEVFSYNNTKGEPFRNSYRDVLFHIISHSVHHRAQINLLLKEDGVDAVVNDYIFYKR